MTEIYCETIDNAQQVKQAFAKLDRDYFPIEIYQYIIDALMNNTDAHATQLDVIAWCGELMSTQLDETEFQSIKDLVSHLEGVTSVIHVANDVVYYASY